MFQILSVQRMIESHNRCRIALFSKDYEEYCSFVNCKIHSKITPKSISVFSTQTKGRSINIQTTQLSSCISKSIHYKPKLIGHYEITVRRKDSKTGPAIEF